jgi:hypothetical protein
MRLRPIALALTAVSLVAAPTIARAQQTQPSAVTQSGVPSTADVMLKGQLSGQSNAQTVGTGGWFAGGFASGLVLGLIGTAVTWAVAGSSDVSLPPDRRLQIANESTAYQEGFQAGYAERLKSRRKGSALAGGLLGTLTIVVIIVSNSGSSQ